MHTTYTYTSIFYESLMSLDDIYIYIMQISLTKEISLLTVEKRLRCPKRLPIAKRTVTIYRPKLRQTNRN